MKEKWHFLSSQSMIGVGIIMFVIGFFSYSLFNIGTGAVSQTKFPFTNPALNYTELAQAISSNKTLYISQQIDTYTKQKEAAGDITQMSIYFRNLNNGGSFGVEEKEYFSPASLMKLPILLSYMKKSEQIPGLLDQKIIYKKNPNISDYEQNIPPEHQLIEGESYTLREILQYLIVYSDNNASAILEANLPMADLQKTFSDIGLRFPPIISGAFDNNIRVIDYASFLRVLFNASYLNRPDSEKALNLLTKVEFKDGLVAGVSTNIVIAHKFGERGIVGAYGVEQKQLHDCGIIYYPNHPYILCVMTRGYDWAKLKSVISDVSSIVYQETKKNYGDDPDSE